MKDGQKRILIIIAIAIIILGGLFPTLINLLPSSPKVSVSSESPPSSKKGEKAAPPIQKKGKPDEVPLQKVIPENNNSIPATDGLIESILTKFRNKDHGEYTFGDYRVWVYGPDDEGSISFDVFRQTKLALSVTDEISEGISIWEGVASELFTFSSAPWLIYTYNVPNRYGFVNCEDAQLLTTIIDKQTAKRLNWDSLKESPGKFTSYENACEYWNIFPTVRADWESMKK